MRYISLSADHMAPSVRDAYGDGSSALAELPDELRSRIEQWNVRYQPIVSMTLQDRSTPRVRALIERLDGEGLNLAGEIEAVFGEAKVSYFSEGRLSLIPDEQR